MDLVRPELVIGGHGHRQYKRVAELVTRRGNHYRPTNLRGGREAHRQVGPNPRPVEVWGRGSHLGDHAPAGGLAGASHGDTGEDLGLQLRLPSKQLPSDGHRVRAEVRGLG